MARMLTPDWNDIVKVTYEVARDKIGRRIDYESVLSKTLDVKGEYEVNDVIFSPRKIQLKRPRNVIFELMTLRLFFLPELGTTQYKTRTLLQGMKNINNLMKT